MEHLLPRLPVSNEPSRERCMFGALELPLPVVWPLVPAVQLEACDRQAAKVPVLGVVVLLA